MSSKKSTLPTGRNGAIRAEPEINKRQFAGVIIGYDWILEWYNCKDPVTFWDRRYKKERRRKDKYLVRKLEVRETVMNEVEGGEKK